MEELRNAMKIFSPDREGRRQKSNRTLLRIYLYCFVATAMQESEGWVSERVLKERAMSSNLSGGNEECYGKSYLRKSAPLPRFERRAFEIQL